MYVYAAVKIYVLFPFVLSLVPRYQDVVLQAVLAITHSADIVADLDVLKTIYHEECGCITSI